MLYLQASQQFHLSNGGAQQFRPQGGAGTWSQQQASRAHDMYSAATTPAYGMMQPNQPTGVGLSSQFGHPGDPGGFTGVQDGALAMAQMSQQLNMPHNSPATNQQRMGGQRNSNLWMNRQVHQQQMWGMMDRDLGDSQYYTDNLREAALMGQQGGNPFAMGLGNNLSLQMDDNGMYPQQGSGGGGGPPSGGFGNRGLDERQF